MEPDAKKSTENDLLGRVFPLADLIGYQEAAVVSRTLVKKATGTVTLFAFDRAQELSEHTSPFDAMAQVLEGEVVITISGNPQTLRAGEFVIMPANEPHALKAADRLKMLLVMIRS
jgi:quercetin dioxygenase-like cupin family protein